MRRALWKAEVSCMWRVLVENREKLNMLVEALLAQETLNRAEFVALMDEGKMPDGDEADKPRAVAQILEEARRTAATETEEKTEDESGPEAYRPPEEKDDTVYLND